MFRSYFGWLIASWFLGVLISCLIKGVLDGQLVRLVSSLELSSVDKMFGVFDKDWLVDISLT